MRSQGAVFPWKSLVCVTRPDLRNSGRLARRPLTSPRARPRRRTPDPSMSFDETTEITEIPNAPRELREETTREAVVARDAGTTTAELEATTAKRAKLATEPEATKTTPESEPEAEPEPAPPPPHTSSEEKRARELQEREDAAKKTNAAAPAPAPAAASGAFVPSETFAGARPGYVFKQGPDGVGYYVDELGDEGGNVIEHVDDFVLGLFDAVVWIPREEAEFAPSKKFAGAKRGYAFKRGPRGLGYYKDRPLTATSGSLDASRPALQADGTIACAIFAHLQDPKDRVALAAVSRVFRDAEKSDASLPGGSAAAVFKLSFDFVGAYRRRRRLDHHELIDTETDMDLVKALYWMRKAADLENADAMYSLGKCYDDGHGVEEDETKANEWYERAVARYRVLAESERDSEASEAMCHLGYLYARGEGVDQDQTKMIEWLERANEFGHAIASDILGHCYNYGIGVEKNAPKAVELYIQALELDEDILWDDPADLGSESQRVQWNLGQIYEHGKPGVAVNKTEALKWYRAAVDFGDSDARDDVERLESELQGA